MMKTIRELIIDEDGTAAVEYALIAFVLIIAAVGVNSLFARALKACFERIARFRTGWVGMGP
jgi:Flp pilus assembly pilin Flp